ncbi:hypothetical protein [Streptosporangium canum]|uniref:hypothetical protein n=1 Tax=Streptosporangium canum TaxID=324952 RepID=UPI00378867D6
MTRPYTEPAAFPLTSEDTEFLRNRLQADEATLQNARAGRLALQVQLASRDRVITTLERSIEQARQALGEDPPTDHPITSQGDRLVHASQWGNVDPNPTRTFQTNEPVGNCAGCKEPLWQGATGLVHAYGGADCFPEREDTTVASLAEEGR